MTISVVIPTYNRAAQLTEAVKSVREQTFPATEIIIVDDGSTDATEELFANVAEPVRYIKTANNGVSSARNVGIKAAKGDWIAFLDSDDKWHPTKLERQVQCISATKAKVCYTGGNTNSGTGFEEMAIVDRTLVLGAQKYYPKPYDLIFRYRLHPVLPTLLVEKQALERVGLFDESLYAGEDTKLIYQLAFSYGAAYIHEPLVTIDRERPVSGLSDSVDPVIAARRLECSIRVVSEAYWRLLDLDAQSAKAMRRCIGYFCGRRAEIACVLGEDNLTNFAKNGLLFSGDWKTFVRCLLLLVVPFIYRPKLRRKWRETVSSPASALP